MKTAIAAVFSLVFATAPAIADEAWTSQVGDIIYERDLENGMAVLSYPLDPEDPARGEAFIFGLAGEFEGRGRYDGVWIVAGEGEGCEVSIAHPETGEPVHYWGRVELIFLDPDWPGSFVAQRGNCFEEPRDFLAARPFTAEDYGKMDADQ